MAYHYKISLLNYLAKNISELTLQHRFLPITAYNKRIITFKRLEGTSYEINRIHIICPLIF